MAVCGAMDRLRVIRVLRYLNGDLCPPKFRSSLLNPEIQEFLQKLVIPELCQVLLPQDRDYVKKSFNLSEG